MDFSGLMQGQESTAVNMSISEENEQSRNLSVNWYDISIREKERQMVQFIGNSKVRRDSNVLEEAISLTEIGSTSSGKEATTSDSSIVRILATDYCTFEPHRRRNDSTRDAGPRPDTSQLEGFCIPSRMLTKFDIHIECWTHGRRARRS